MKYMQKYATTEKVATSSEQSKQNIRQFMNYKNKCYLGSNSGNSTNYSVKKWS